ncbi:hypothetical protein [Oceanobacillus neutriphilus]|uniref:Uncharacterized protein n=1 Tax=Oceanobacillus neutriphilus TaxID=531815 RepID=A0ABQ2NTW1_9BACI|nr:hypothetical protein [Oceanobacillus neutriphilus]GGP10423.1 hypothetical protein GCM10011346_18490 [Oceanobacillus neutriphilus]
MPKFLTYDEILQKCEEINKKYQMKQEHFDEIVWMVVSGCFFREYLWIVFKK